MRFNGWEIIGDPIGRGGQSIVYLARNPNRGKEREVSRLSLQDLSNRAKQDLYADAIYLYSRLDLPAELGALKEFHFRPGSAKPIERLKREVAILSEGRAGLPRLLDSNVDELWMVTEYFRSGTLADLIHQNKFKGRALEALKVFRGLIETVAALHDDNVVHRDIKPANVFWSEDGKLILGDFGLVYFGGEADSQVPRLTRTGETIGPWEHLPWWAKSGVRLENPTPAVDVFLLGNLLWCMVASESRFEFGERYKHPIYNLEARFSKAPYMQLVNLVLSQCLGDDETKCVKTAGVLLKIVDEVLDAIKDRAPITDENNVLVIPCRFCYGFYERVLINEDQQTRGVIQLVSGPVASSGPIYLNVLQCGICKNIQLFSQGEPFEAFRVRRVPRINPQKPPPKKSSLMW
jgi:serine/threonine protein kinase